MAIKETITFFNWRIFKALLVLMVVGTVVLSVLLDVAILATGDSQGVRVSIMGHLSDGNGVMSQKQHDTLISFVYSESAFARENIQYFVKIGLHHAADFVFIFNGETTAANFLPNWDNIKVVHRNNTCYDMGAVGEVMQNDGLWKNYKKFISINASIRGPFIPYWADACWTDLYLNKVTDVVKLVGMTANCNPRGHIQSMIFATDDIGMGILLDRERATTGGVADWYGSADDPVGLSSCYTNHGSAVHSEIGLATLIQNAGYEVDVMMAAFHQDTNTDLQAYCNASGGKGDVLSNGAYFGFNIHPYETIFMKTNRFIDPVAISKLTEWHLKRNVTALNLCTSK